MVMRALDRRPTQAPPARPKPPAGTYLLCAIFLFAGVLGEVLLLPPILNSFGFDPERGLLLQAGSSWVLFLGVLAFLFVCVGVVGMARAHPIARWSLLLLSGLVISSLLLAPTLQLDGSAASLSVARLLLGFPLAGACLWMALPGYRTACREFRRPVSTHNTG
jgi:hypothetical protein